MTPAVSSTRRGQSLQAVQKFNQCEFRRGGVGGMQEFLREFDRGCAVQDLNYGHGHRDALDCSGQAALQDAARGADLQSTLLARAIPIAPTHGRSVPSPTQRLRRS